MGISARLDALTLHVTSPDGNIAARLRHRREVRIAFRPGSYRAYQSRDLELQLAQLGKLLWVQYRRGYDAIMDEAGMRVIAEPADADAPADRELLAKREDMTVEATSPQKMITLRTKAMLRWKITLAADVDRLDEKEFIGETHAAINTLFSHWQEAVRQAHAEVTDPKRARARARAAHTN